MLESVSAESNKGGKAPLTFWFPSWNLISGNILIAVYSERHVIFNPVWSVAMSHTYTIMLVNFEDNCASQESRSSL